LLVWGWGEIYALVVGQDGIALLVCSMVIKIYCLSSNIVIGTWHISNQTWMFEVPKFIHY
jgi:hypothetical protein